MRTNFAKIPSIMFMQILKITFKVNIIFNRVFTPLIDFTVYLISLNGFTVFKFNPDLANFLFVCYRWIYIHS